MWKTKIDLDLEDYIQTRLESWIMKLAPAQTKQLAEYVLDSNKWTTVLVKAVSLSTLSLIIQPKGWDRQPKVLKQIPT